MKFILLIFAFICSQVCECFRPSPTGRSLVREALSAINERCKRYDRMRWPQKPDFHACDTKKVFMQDHLYFVLIHSRSPAKRNSTSKVKKCSGTIVSTQFILTAANCVEGYHPSSVEIRVLDEATQHYNVTRASKIIPYRGPDYDSSKAYMFDIALVQLEKPLVFDVYTRLKAARLPIWPFVDRAYDAKYVGRFFSWRILLVGYRPELRDSRHPYPMGLAMPYDAVDRSVCVWNIAHLGGKLAKEYQKRFAKERTLSLFSVEQFITKVERFDTSPENKFQPKSGYFVCACELNLEQLTQIEVQDNGAGFFTENIYDYEVVRGILSLSFSWLDHLAPSVPLEEKLKFFNEFRLSLNPKKTYDRLKENLFPIPVISVARFTPWIEHVLQGKDPASYQFDQYKEYVERHRGVFIDDPYKTESAEE